MPKPLRIDRNVTLLLLSLICSCSSSPAISSVGLDMQVYPTGHIDGLRVDHELEESSRTVSLHLGYNSADRGDAGEHDEEEGGGPGIGLSGRQYWGSNFDGWFAGARLDLWFLDLDWERGSGPSPSRGQTDIVVLQPTVTAGYRWLLPHSPLAIDLYAAGGVEINVATSGEEVGEGAIGLAGVGLSYKF